MVMPAFILGFLQCAVAIPPNITIWIDLGMQEKETVPLFVSCANFSKKFAQFPDFCDDLTSLQEILFNIFENVHNVQAKEPKNKLCDLCQAVH